MISKSSAKIIVKNKNITTVSLFSAYSHKNVTRCKQRLILYPILMRQRKLCCVKYKMCQVCTKVNICT